MKNKHGYYDIFVQACSEHTTRVGVRHFTNGAFKCYTYSELYGICEYISQNLQQLQCQKGIIGIMTERNPIIPCVIAAVHKNSPTFMFLDPTKDNSSIMQNVSFEAMLYLHPVDQTSNVMEKKPDREICVYNIVVKFYKMGRNVPNSTVDEHSFIVSTSGSTGEPKHVKVPIQCIQPNIDDLAKMFEITSIDVVYFSTPLSFDPSMVELLLACTYGASLLIAPETVNTLFSDSENSITIWQTTPSKFFQFSYPDISNIILSKNSKLKILALGGEPMNHIKQLKELKADGNRTRIYCLYGVTELSCWACVTEIDVNKMEEDREIPLGNCLSETKLEITPAKKKTLGKIILGSNSRKCTILNKTERRCSPRTNKVKWVDTGDIGEIINGTIYYRGRIDEVIKRFGHKVNLQHIEKTAMRCPKVKSCSCLWLQKVHILILYYSSEEVLCKDLGLLLKRELDDKHWPDRIVRLDAMPVNKHGKICKLSLEGSFTSEHSEDSFDYIKSLFIEELIISLKHTFVYEDIKNKDFFAIGGTSFVAAALCNKLALTYPQFSQPLFSYLLSPKMTIENIITNLRQCYLNEDELSSVKSNTRKKRRKSTIVNRSPNMKKLSVPRNMLSIRILWSYDTGKCVDASPTVFKSAKNVYLSVGSHSGKLLVKNISDGSTSGVIELQSRIEASVFCYQHRIVIGEATGVVGTYDGTIVCFSLNDCTIAWRLNINSMIKSKATSAKGQLYVASYDGNLRCLDFLNGNIISTISIGDHGISSDLATAKNEFVLVATLAGVCAGVSARNNIILWRHQLNSPIFASPVVYDNDKLVLFAEVNGVVHCHTVEMGIPIWIYEGAKGNIFSSFAISKASFWQIVFGCHDCYLYSLHVQDHKIKLKWKCLQSAPVYSTPCFLTDSLIVAASNNGKLSIIDAESADLVAMYELPDETFSSPVAYNDQLFLGCRDDRVYSLQYSVINTEEQ